MGVVNVEKRDAAPQAFVFETTGVFDGVDGQWSTFQLSAGTPPQSFRVLASSITSYITLPFPEGCPATGWDDCGKARGVNDYLGQPSTGFDYSKAGASKTWKLLGLDDLFETIYPGDSGEFGLDTITIPKADNETAVVAEQVIAGMDSGDYLMGAVALGNTNYSYPADGVRASFLANMKQIGIIPSVSYAYTAGQWYSNTPGSLILGGYDTTRQSSATINTPVQTVNSTQSLIIDVQTVNAGNGLNGVVQALGDKSISMSIDSSVNQIWFPEDVCDRIADNFGLTYDNVTGFYLVNDTMHTILQQNNAQLTFTIGGLGTPSSGNTNIVLPYNALNTVVGFPIYSSNANYFPIRRAANAYQYVLGRTFLQEAYLIVNWDNGTFNIGPVLAPSSTTNIQVISSPTLVSSSSSAANTSVPDPTPSGIGTGAIAGIVIAVSAIAAVAGVIFCWQRRKPQHKRWSMFSMSKNMEAPPPAYHDAAEFYGDKPREEVAEVKTPHHHFSELYDSSNPRAELVGSHAHKLEEMVAERELMSTPVHELKGDNVGSEMDVTSPRSSLASGSNTARSSTVSPARMSVLSGQDKARSPLSPSTVFEME